MRRLALIALVLVAAAVVAAVASASGSGGDHGNYRVRAIFDDASFAVAGEQVRVAGAPVGSIAALDVTRGKQAAVTLAIDDARFTPFHANATCAIRPQSLIGEMYVDCNPGTSAAPALHRITSGPGAGTYYLPVLRTHSPVDFDISQDIYREPIAQRLAIILNELGTGLAARGSDLNAVIHRADPAKLATDSAAVLTPLAKQRKSLADFIVQANTTAVASAERARDISRSIQLLPGFLRQLKPLMVDLGTLADQGTPVAGELNASASALGREFTELTPFAKAARTSLIALGNAAAKSQAPLLATLPLDRRLERLGNQTAPAATLLDRLTASLDKSGAFGQLMALLFYGTSAANGFDSLGHYVRDELLVSNCTGYALNPVPGCSANFAKGASASVASDVSSLPKGSQPLLKAALAGATVAQRSAGPLHGLLDYLIGPTAR
jgi:ABC-type transporter Mla subunit MlaD